MGNQLVDLVTLGEELRDLQTVKSAVPQTKIPRTNHKERKELKWPFPCDTKAFTKQHNTKQNKNKQTLVKQTNQLQWKPRKEFFLKGLGRVHASISKCLPLRAKETECHKTTKDLRGGRGKTFATQHREGIKMGTLILGSASEWTSQCDRQDGW
jgi:hypothetical protein